MNPLLVRIVLGLADALGILSVIQGLLKSVSQEKIPFLIESTVVATSLNVGSPSYGLAALHTQIQGVKDDLDASVASLTLQIIGLTDGTTPVALPVVPPSGYGAPTGSAMGDAVWNYQYGTSGRQTGEWLNWAGTDVLKKWVESVTFTYGMYWLPVEPPLEDPGSYTQNFPTFNPGDLVAGETFLDCVTRQNPGMLTISQYYTNGPIYVATPITATLNQWVSTIDGFDYARMQALTFPLKESLVIPIWPGVANATLGTSVALDRTVTLTEEMDGVIVTLTSVPPDKPKYILGSLTATAHIGQIAFIADNGAAEYPQNLSFASEIYIPLALVGASSVVLRTVPGVSGTVQAWKRTP